MICGLKNLKQNTDTLYSRLRVAGLLIFLVVVFMGSTVKATPRTITDMAGRKVTIKDPVDRMITTFKPASLCVLSLGLQDKLVGIDTSSIKDPLQKAVFPEVANVTAVGAKSKGINFETLVSLKPDLVILYSQKDGLSLADRLEAMGIPAVIIIPETFDSIKETLRVIAAAAGLPERTRMVEEQMDKMLDFVNLRVKDLPDDKKKTAYFSSSKGIFSTATGNMLQNEIFEKGGVINVSRDLKGYFQNISPEQLVKWNPDIMVFTQHSKKSETQRLSDKALQQITAVSQKTVYRCPSSIAPWDFPSPLSVLASLWIAKKAYPERFKDVEIKDQADEFHRLLFRKTLTQINGTLQDTVY